MNRARELDADLARGVRRIERMPLRVVAFGFAGSSGMLLIDWIYNHELTAVAWLAVVGIATVTIPITSFLRWQSGEHTAWAEGEQERRRQPPKRPPEKRSRADLTPVPDVSPERKAGSS